MSTHRSGRDVLARAITALGLVLLTAALIDSLIAQVRGPCCEHNMFVQQAVAFLQGRLDLPHRLHDVAIHDGLYYMPFPPLPALLLVPVVAVLGAQATNTVILGILLTGMSIMLFRRILARLQLANTTVRYTLLAFFFGTVYWFALIWSDTVWFTAHVVATLMLFLALDEALGKQRAALAGLYLGGALLTRQLTIAAAPLLAALLWDGAQDESLGTRWRHMMLFALPIAACGLAYLGLNVLRFGNPLDTGYGRLALQGFLRTRFETYGLFSIRYLPVNLYYLLIEGFHLEFTDPMHMGGMRRYPFGVSLLSASPFVVLSLRARWKPHLLAAAWVSILLGMIPSLMYYNNGWVQFGGQRFALDYLPMLMLLVALGAERSPSWLYRGMTIYALVLNVLGLVVLPRLGAA